MSHEPSTTPPAGADDPTLTAPPDEANPAMIDAGKTLLYTVIGAAAFIGAVVVFIL